MKKDYYNILGVGKTFSEDDLKKAYKKACLKYHPDRLAGKSEDEKKKGEEKFKDIQEAYECLSDPQKKQYYDTHGSMDGYGQGWSAGADVFGQFADFFSDFGFGGFGGFGGFPGFGGTHRTSSENPRQPGKTYKIAVHVGIEEIFKGTTKKFKFDREVRCEYCHGKGGEGVEVCDKCNGTGMITQTQRSSFGIIQNTRPCPYCGGTGQTVKKTCTHCHGTGMKTIKSEIEIKIPMGVPNGYSEVLRGKGGESPAGSMGIPGDVIYIVQYDIDTTRYQITPNAVYELLDVNYYDLILGTTIKRKLPNDKVVDVNIPKCSKNEDQVVINRAGYKNKDYIFILNPVFPSSLSKDEKTKLEEIRKIHN